MRRSPRLDHSQEAEKELAVAALLACTAEVRQPTFGVAREEHVRLPLAIRLIFTFNEDFNSQPFLKPLE